MTMREALDAAMHRQSSDEAMATLKERGSPWWTWTR